VHYSELLNDLLSIAPPPEHPIDFGTPEQWPTIENALGIALPEDYKLITNKYGTGGFCDLFALYNPFSKTSSVNLLCQVGYEAAEATGILCQDIPLLDRYREARASSFRKMCPFAAYPEPGGLLPVGGDSNGGEMFWLTSGQPDSWTLVLYDPRGGWQHEQYTMPLIVFLVEWISERMPQSFFGAGSDPEIIRHDPVFCRAGQVRPPRPEASNPSTW
jgi:hypothetical protein